MTSKVIAVLALLMMALASAVAVAAPYAAGETQRTTTTTSAAVRNHGDARLRLLAWYPAPVASAEIEVGAGPVFIAGRVAAGAAFADARRHPLILVSHGFGGTARQMTWLGAALARQGYVVVAVDHPGTNGRDGVTAEGAAAPWERAGDLRAALDFVLADPRLGPHIDAGRIGVAGFSLGGYTGALMVGARADPGHFARFCAGRDRDAICDPQLEFQGDLSQVGGTLAQPWMRDVAARQKDDFRDPRIKAAFLIAPAMIQALDPASFRRIHVPVEIVLGDADPIAPPATNGELLARRVLGSTLLILPRVRHYDFLSECGPAGPRVAGAYCADGAGMARAQTHATTIAAAIAFFNGTLRGQG